MLRHPPAEILATALEAVGIVSYATPSVWPCFVPHLADVPTGVGIRSTSPVSDGRLMTGPHIRHPGVAIICGSPDSGDSFRKIQQILQFAEDTSWRIVIVGATSYTIQAISLASGPFDLGLSDNHRFEWTLNLTMTVTLTP